MSKQRTRWLVFLTLLAAAIVFRISVAHWLANDTPDDARVYSQLARNVLEQHVYAETPAAPFSPVYIRTPGYPLFIAFVYSIFGHMNNGAVRIAQALVDSITCILVALFAALMQGDENQRPVTLSAAMVLAAANPFTTIYTSTLLPEVLTTFFAIASCVVALIALRTANPRRSLLLWCLTGLLAGAGVMVRPDSGLFAGSIGLILIIVILFRLRERLRYAISACAICFLSFAVVLLPWTIRNWRVFHVFQPLAPATASMPGDFVARGYSRWLRTWLDDQRYVDRLWWGLDSTPIAIKTIPDKAFDSPEERIRVAALLYKYNHPAGSAAGVTEASNPPDAISKDNESSEDEEESEVPEEAADQNNASDVEMTPEIDAGFGQIANERISRSPLRYYLSLPLRRSAALWFNTHSDYYPFAGDLLPLDELDYDIHQHVWLPLFASLVAFYSLVGLFGGIVLWISRSFTSRLGLLLVLVIFVSRLALFSTTESLEPRYVVEFFPFLAALGGIAIARILKPPLSPEV